MNMNLAKLCLASAAVSLLPSCAEADNSQDEPGAQVSQAFSASPGSRIGQISSTSYLVVKDGPLDQSGNNAWVPEVNPTVTQGAMSGTRIAALVNGKCQVKDTADLRYGTWSVMLTNVKQCLVAGNRVAVLTNDNRFLVKEGALNAQWVEEYKPVKQGSISGNLIGVVTGDGAAVGANHFLVKQGALSAGWTDQYSPVKTGIVMNSLQNNDMGNQTTMRIGILSGNNFLVKEGSLNAQWVLQTTSALTIALGGGNCLGYVDGTINYSFWAKCGALNSTSWTRMFDNVDQAVISNVGGSDPIRFGTHIGSTFKVKERSLNGWWTDYPTASSGVLPTN